MDGWTGKTLGGYRVVRLLGAGGMGEVYEAVDLRLGRHVALKVLPGRMAADPERLQRFTRETRALAALNHPGIVTIYSVDEAEGEHFFTMELVQGKTLAECIPAGGLELGALLDLAVLLADALGAAHECGIVHRDLKPSNVMVTGAGRVKVLDFGVAKLRPGTAAPGGDLAPTETPTADGMLLGTMAYMSPEQFTGKPVDARSDLFSLGVVLYEMACGRLPFSGPNIADLMAQVLNQTPASLRSYNPRLPATLERLIFRCVEKDPAHRPASAAEVRAELEALRHATTVGESVANGAAMVTPTVAVLPFADMSAGHDQAYFCDGIAEELINALAHLEGLRVTSRTSSFSFKDKLEDVREIGRRLGVSAVLEGSVRRAGDRLRITVQLVNVADGYHLWSERFDRNADNIFAIQDEISLGVVEKLRVNLVGGEQVTLPRRHVPSQEAYHLFLKARYFLNRRQPGGLQRAIEHFEKAIAADPSYALPHVGIAETFAVLGLWGYLPPREAFGRARAAAERALELDASLAEAHATLASILYLHYWEWTEGERHFKLAQQLPRADWTGLFGFGVFHLAAGRTREAIEVGRHLVEAEPLSSIAHTQAAAFHIGVGEISTGALLLEKALELDPNMPMALSWMGFCRGVQGRNDEAANLMHAATARGLTSGPAFLPELLVRAGKQDAAREAVAASDALAEKAYVSPLWRALAHAAVGDRDRAVELLGLAEAERSPNFTFLVIGPGFRMLAPVWVQEWFADRAPRLGLVRVPAQSTVVPGGRKSE
ncbi:MAG: protein kinase [Thermoanaerobaculales bacterium]